MRFSRINPVSIFVVEFHRILWAQTTSSFFRIFPCINPDRNRDLHKCTRFEFHASTIYNSERENHQIRQPTSTDVLRIWRPARNTVRWIFILATVFLNMNLVGSILSNALVDLKLSSASDCNLKMLTRKHLHHIRSRTILNQINLKISKD